MVTRPQESTAAILDSAAQQPGFVADQTGEYVVGLVVSDGEASSPEQTVRIKVKSLVLPLMILTPV